MRRLALIAPVVVVGALALTGCSGAGSAGDAAGKSAGSAGSAAATHGKPVDRVTVIDGMHYVQLFNVVDPVVADLEAATDGPPPSTELRSAATSLHQFATQARGLPSTGNSGQTVHRLAIASTALAHQLSALAADGKESPSTSGAKLTAALAGFRSASAAARKAAGLPAVKTSSKPHPDTGP
jgi:hypothetical protein